jgi:hypothetical protein
MYIKVTNAIDLPIVRSAKRDEKSVTTKQKATERKTCRAGELSALGVNLTSWYNVAKTC